MPKSSRSFFVVLMLCVLVTPVIVLAQDAPRGELVIALPNNPTSLYSPNSADVTASNAAAPMYDSLIAFDDNGDLIPALAESWAIEDDTIYTFTLRQGVTFHNGEPFNADSVIATWEFGKTETNQFTDTFDRAISVEALDEYQVRITTNEPDPLFLRNIALDWWMIPAGYMNEVGIDAFELAPVGTGSFVFVERVSGERIVYEANPDYWRENEPRVERVIFRIIPDSTARVAALQTGEVDIANRLSVDEITLLELSDTTNIISYTNDRIYYIGFKGSSDGDSPLDDARVRQALNLAVNRQEIIENLFSGEGQPIAGFTVEGNLGFDDSVTPFPYDPEQAQALLAEAGYGDGFESSIGCPTDAYNNINQVCLAIQRDLAEIGVEVAVEFRTTNSYWAEPSYGNVGDMYVDSWSSAVGEALPRLQGALIPGNYYNTWQDETIIGYINDISTTLDRDARGELYSELQSYMVENPPFIYLYILNLFEATSTRVEGYSPRANEGYDLNRVSLRN